MPERLRYVTVQPFGVVSAVHEAGGDVIHIVLCTAEYKAVEILFHVYHLAQRFEFIRFGDFKIYLICKIHSKMFVFHRQHHLVFHIFTGY